MKRTEREYLIGLNLIPQLTPKRNQVLIKRFASFEDIWKAPASAFANLFGSRVLGEAIASARSETALDEEFAKAEDKVVRIVTLVDEEYPPLLREIDDPPMVLYVRGEQPIDSARAIAIVGTRRGTRYGKMIAGRFASQLALKNFIIVSGLAAGIDAAAHQGTLDVGGFTVAVMGCGIDYPYPKRNQPIYERIVETGVVMSEYPMGSRPAKWTFPQRNRILSGLSRGVLVVQAPERSGSLITARCALEQGRDVFAVPGNINSLTSAGSNRLLKQGAKLVDSVDDILDEYPDLKIGRGESLSDAQPAPHKLGDAEAAVYELIDLEPVHMDDIIARADLSPTEASHILLLLQLEDLIEEAEGGRYIRKL
ncbi:DNA-processing protein DprA [Candidatus Bipolaricaulota bacterium]